ncbi:terminase large subunit domain-containing protein [Glacieibacterium frigidum]|uniref:ATP-binding protein n=1 Tax=Glacieibacterium frigidum TaxID=2593303 RepID=A0A552U824_9SPHN|nr:terminase family protein [Glacieibacterium frigidum]TRW14373.1 ATP-binding protein [Glacieibacterium frigidum]
MSADDALTVDQVAAIPADDAVAVAESFMVRGPQKPPKGDWTTWLILAGRGFGKTATGAAFIDELAIGCPGARIALIAATAADARAVMVEGEAGLLARNPAINFSPARRRLAWPGGSSAMLFSAADTEQVRGPSFHFAWGDEAAHWDRGDAVLANLRMALRLGDHPRLLLTTTPKPLRWLKQLAVAPGVVTTRGRTADNAANLPAPFVEGLTRDYAGTARGRQELDGEFVDATEGALWSREGLEACRIGSAPPCVRIVVAVDPPAGAGARADACGIVVAGLDAKGRGIVLADRSVQGLQPAAWARAVVAAADDFGADLVIAEANNGGTMVTHTLRGVDSNLNVRAVHASAGKVARAEPVAALYDAGRVSHAGVFPDLEDEMCALGRGGAWDGPGSPDRADALVWALTELMLGKRRAEPGVRML